MVTHTFKFKLKKEFLSKSKKSKLVSRIKKSLLYSDEFTFGKNLTITEPRIVINRKNIKVTVELFTKPNNSLLKTAENKVMKYLHQYYGYEIENSKYNKTKKIKSNISKNRKTFKNK